MAEKKSFLRKLSPAWFGFFLSALFITLLITAYFTQGVTEKVRDNFVQDLVQECSDVGFTGLQLEWCIEKSKEGGTFAGIKPEDCGGCGDNQLCLVGEDKEFCEKNVKEGSILIKIGSILDKITAPLTNLNFFTIGIIVSIIFLTGASLKRVWEKK